MPAHKRRSSDWLPVSTTNLLACLAIASAMLAAYISNRAIRSMNEAEKANEMAYRIGKVIGASKLTHDPEGY